MGLERKFIVGTVCTGNDRKKEMEVCMGNV